MLQDVFVNRGLSNREAQVACLVCKGLSNNAVAKELFVTEKTVKFHLTNIYKKIKVKSRAELIVWSLPHLGFVERSDHEENELPLVITEVAALSATPADAGGLPKGRG